ncbi:MAG: ThiF family adenylyltransferase [Prolixibacteraceae bacterium]
MNWLNKTELLLGVERLSNLKEKNILVVGLGGVGAYAAESLCRSGIGKMTIVDGDVVEITNLNRQLPGMHSNLGREKAEVLAERFRDINPEIELVVINEYLRDERMLEILNTDFDYVVDCIDTLAPKIYLIVHALSRGLKLVSSMGAGGKLDPQLIQVTDISKSYNCKLARILRKRLGRLGVRSGFQVVFSPEEVPEEAVREEEGVNKKSTVGTISYMPPAFGCFMASVVIRNLIADN